MKFCMIQKREQFSEAENRMNSLTIINYDWNSLENRRLQHCHTEIIRIARFMHWQDRRTQLTRRFRNKGSEWRLKKKR